MGIHGCPPCGGAGAVQGSGETLLAIGFSQSVCWAFCPSDFWDLSEDENNDHNKDDDDSRVWKERVISLSRRWVFVKWQVLGVIFIFSKIISNLKIVHLYFGSHKSSFYFLRKIIVCMCKLFNYLNSMWYKMLEFSWSVHCAFLSRPDSISVPHVWRVLSGFSMLLWKILQGTQIRGQQTVPRKGQIISIRGLQTILSGSRLLTWKQLWTTWTWMSVDVFQ